MIETSHGHDLIAGTGAVARTFGRLLTRAGDRVAFASRDAARARDAADSIGDGASGVVYEDVPEDTERVLLAVADGAITEVAARLATAKTNIRIALHTSGNAAVEALQSLRARGVACGSMHPLQTLTGQAKDLQALRGAAFALAGDEAALQWARHVADLAGGEPLEISPRSKSTYHAAAVVASNYVTALVDASEALMGEAGISSAQARRILRPILQTAVVNAVEQGPTNALTGPILRGDVSTVRSHLHAISQAPESIQILYRTAGMHTVAMAERRGLSEQVSREIRKLLVKDMEENGPKSS